jgi:hypothetical protein
MKLILLLTLGAITSVSLMAPTPTATPGIMTPALKVTSHCATEEKVIFSCATTNAKVISLCSSSPLTSSNGYLQYRFGPADKPELVYPATRAHPSKYFQLGTLLYSGGGGEFLKFRNGEYTYIVFSAIGKGWEKAGVVVSKSEKRIAYLPCKGAGRFEMPPQEFEQIKIPRDLNEADFEIP